MKLEWGLSDEQPPPKMGRERCEDPPRNVQACRPVKASAHQQKKPLWEGLGWNNVDPLKSGGGLHPLDQKVEIGAGQRCIVGIQQVQGRLLEGAHCLHHAW